MEVRNIEKEYLENNSKYSIEKNLLTSLKIDEIKDFIEPLLEEYEDIDECINKKLKKALKDNEGLDEISKYLIELIVTENNEGERKEELEKTLTRFNSHLYSRLPQNYQYNQRKLDIEEIDIKAIISKYIKLPNNINRNICCPFPHHDDKSPSFKIYGKTNSFYCFGCGCGGNVLNFLSYMENTSTKEAYKRLLDLV